MDEVEKMALKLAESLAEQHANAQLGAIQAVLAALFDLLIKKDTVSRREVMELFDKLEISAASVRTDAPRLASTLLGVTVSLRHSLEDKTPAKN